MYFFFNKDLIICLFADEMIVLSNNLAAAQNFVDI